MSDAVVEPVVAAPTNDSKQPLPYLPTTIEARPEQRTHYAWTDAFGAALSRWEPLITQLARELAHDDGERADDLRQEAMIRLWELEPSRFGAGEEKLVERALLDTILRARRREKRHTTARRRVTMEQAAVEAPLLGLLEEEVAGWGG